MRMNRRQAIQLIATAVPASTAPAAFSFTGQAATPASNTNGVTKFVFDGVYSEQRIPIKELGLDSPADLSPLFPSGDGDALELTAAHVAMDLYHPWMRSMGFIAFGQNAWLRASVPLHFFVGQDSNGFDLASAGNRRTNSCWFSVWGPYGDLQSVEAIAFSMEYALNNPSIELRNVHLSKADEGSEFLEPGPQLDSFGQWALADWPRKLHSQEQLTHELAEEEKSFGGAAHFGYSPLRRLREHAGPRHGLLPR